MPTLSVLPFCNKEIGISRLVYFRMLIPLVLPFCNKEIGISRLVYFRMPIPLVLPFCNKEIGISRTTIISIGRKQQMFSIVRKHWKGIKGFTVGNAF